MPGTVALPAAVIADSPSPDPRRHGVDPSGRRRRWAVVGLLAVVVVLTACTDDTAVSDPTTGPTATNDPQAATTPDGHRVPAVIASGKTALLVLEVTADTRDQLPASVSHQISASFGPAETGGGGIAVLWADTVSQTGGDVTLSTDEPVVIGAPLSGSGWLVSAACCTLNVHRNVLLPVGGRINGGERYAIDVSQIDVASVRENGFTGDAVVHGDPSVNEDYRAYGAAVLAVADATVVAVHSTDPDTVPGTLPLGPGFTLANLGGNVVALQIAPDLFAVYYHLAPDSPTVKVGDRVTKGQKIALLGNSGNTSAAHLHFQVSRTPLIFSSDSVPYEIEEFTLAGQIDGVTGALTDQTGSGVRKDALPLALNVIDFP